MKHHHTLRPPLRPPVTGLQRDPLEIALRTGARLALYFLLGMALMFMAQALIGCSASELRLASAGSAASSGLAANLDTAHGEVNLAEPHADSIGRAHLVSADTAIASGKSKLPAINAGLAQVAPLSAKVKTLEHQFWSPRQRAIAWVIGLSVSALGVVLAILYFATPLSLPIGAAAAGAFHVLTLGVPKLFHGIVSRIHAKAQTRATSTVASVLAAPPTARPSEIAMVATATGMKPA